jgi:hypothetical protein
MKDNLFSRLPALQKWMMIEWLGSEQIHNFSPAFLPVERVSSTCSSREHRVRRRAQATKSNQHQVTLEPSTSIDLQTTWKARHVLDPHSPNPPNTKQPLKNHSQGGATSCSDDPPEGSRHSNTCNTAIKRLNPHPPTAASSTNHNRLQIRLTAHPKPMLN